MAATVVVVVDAVVLCAVVPVPALDGEAPLVPDPLPALWPDAGPDPVLDPVVVDAHPLAVDEPAGGDCVVVVSGRVVVTAGRVVVVVGRVGGVVEVGGTNVVVEVDEDGTELVVVVGTVVVGGRVGGTAVVVGDGVLGGGVGAVAAVVPGVPPVPQAPLEEAEPVLGGEAP